jgi:hypothetical protein
LLSLPPDGLPVFGPLSRSARAAADRGRASSLAQASSSPSDALVLKILKINALFIFA